MSWFVCETDTNMDELYGRISASSVKMHFEASVWLHLNDTKILTVTLNGLSNHSSIHPEEDEDQTGDGEGQTRGFYCCLPLLPTSKSTNQSRCLLWLANRTVLTGTAMEKLPWKPTDEDEWCTIRVIWLALLCVVLLCVLTTVIRQIYFGKHLFTKPKGPPGYQFTSQQLNVGETQPDVTTSKARTRLQSSGLPSWSGLPPIQEDDSQDDVETLLDGNADHCYSANLHHRGHPPTSAHTEEQVW
ncbi:uncharacterized protein LOC106536588 [Austrofundulus limnaeus]|nr:PREDICTED: uncharacterized protein LOC106536588 [Austrofundulus limnaeus]